MHADALNRTRRIALLAVLALGALLAGPHALAASCSVSTSGLNFGAYDPLAGTASTANGSVSLNCRFDNILERIFGPSIQATVALSAGSAGSYVARTLRQGAEQLRYNLYTDATYATVFGDGTGGTSAVPKCFSAAFNPCTGGGATSPVSIPVYGRLPGGQDVGSGSYADSLIVTVAF